jgi:hypothetical protein
MTSAGRAARELPRSKRALGWLVPRALTALLYAAGATAALTGTVMLCGRWRGSGRGR